MIGYSTQYKVVYCIYMYTMVGDNDRCTVCNASDFKWTRACRNSMISHKQPNQLSNQWLLHLPGISNSSIQAPIPKCFQTRLWFAQSNRINELFGNLIGSATVICSWSHIKSYCSPGQRSVCRKIVVYVVYSSTSRAIAHALWRL